MHECMLASWPDPRLGLVLQVMFEEIEIIRPIGEGSFGRVRRRKGDLPCWGVQAALCLCPPPCLAPACARVSAAAAQERCAMAAPLTAAHPPRPAQVYLSRWHHTTVSAARGP